MGSRGWGMVWDWGHPINRFWGNAIGRFGGWAVSRFRSWMFVARFGWVTIFVFLAYIDKILSTFFLFFILTLLFS